MGKDEVLRLRDNLLPRVWLEEKRYDFRKALFICYLMEGVISLLGTRSQYGLYFPYL